MKKAFPTLGILGVVLLVFAPAAHAKFFTCINSSTNTMPGDAWSIGTNWNATPVSGAATGLVFAGAPATGMTISCTNDHCR